MVAKSSHCGLRSTPTAYFDMLWRRCEYEQTVRIVDLFASFDHMVFSKESISDLVMSYGASHPLHLHNAAHTHEQSGCRIIDELWVGAKDCYCEFKNNADLSYYQ
jgi:hypothetical protein